MAKEFSPNFNTADEDLCKEEKNKLEKGILGNLAEDFRDETRQDVAWETEQLAKSHGIYLEFDRAKTGREKDWSYMIRITIPGGGPLNLEQWRALDDVSSKYTKDSDGVPSIRLTTRQNVQYHWVEKKNLVSLIQECADRKLFTLNGCGDNVRNVMACPLGRFSNTFDGNALAQKVANYFQLPAESHIKIFEVDPNHFRGNEDEKRFDYGKKLLNRKFKIGISGVITDEVSGKLVPDNCVEALTNDMAVVPILENEKVVAYQIYVGGGQGERNGKPSMATLAKPVCLTSEENLIKVMDAVVAVHRDFGDRQNRHWARLKYVIKAQGIPWFREQMEGVLGDKLELPNEDYDYGPRMMHHGWTRQESNGLWAYGAYIENGRLKDYEENGRLKTMVPELLEKYNSEAVITANQDLLFTNIDEAAKADFEADLASYGYGKRKGKAYSTLRMLSGACVGRDTCRLTYTDSEKFEPELIDQLDEMGWGDMAESIGITGCERQCFRPSTKTIGLVGTGLDRYQFRLMGSEDGSTQGRPLYNEDRSITYLRSVPRDQVAAVIEVLFKFYEGNKEGEESMGSFHNRVGEQKIIAHLVENPVTAELMENTTKVKAYLEG